MSLTSSSKDRTKSRKEGIVLILSGPSGTGKTTLCKGLLEKLPDLKYNVSHTTRPPRAGEVEGRDYYFVSQNEFLAMQERGDFLEWANFNGNLYGTSFESLHKSRANGQHVLLEVDVQGANALRELKYPGVFIFLLPPSIRELTHRLSNRGTESQDVIEKRIETATEEIKSSLDYDYVLTSNTPQESVDNIIAIFRAEKLKASRFVSPSSEIQALLSSQGNG